MPQRNPLQLATPPMALDQKKDAPSTNGPDIWDANHDGIYTPAMSGRVTLIDYLPWPIATATGISIRPNSQ
jgi:hypothetical protein